MTLLQLLDMVHIVCLYSELYVTGNELQITYTATQSG